jgi:hypothetical protein
MHAIEAGMPACDARLARVVAWLEALAGGALERAQAASLAAGGSGARFARGEGLPRETRLRLAQARGGPGAFPGGGSGGGAGVAELLVTELDPDAATRFGMVFHLLVFFLLFSLLG